jgi:hypothetical protein
MNASGCGASVKDYGHALAHDADYADKARRVSELTRDISELLPDLVPALQGKLRQGTRAGWPFTRRARCSTASSCAAAWKSTWARWASKSAWPPQRATCAAARPAPTACCSRSWRRSCATASWRT